MLQMRWFVVQGRMRNMSRW